MKTIFSGMLSAVIFVTQTVAVCHATSDPANAPRMVSEDARLNLAIEMEKRGEALQRIEDQYGIDVAHEQFETLAKANVEGFLSNQAKVLETISETQARTYFKNITDLMMSQGALSSEQAENMWFQLNQKYAGGMTSKEILIDVSRTLSVKDFDHQIEVIKKRADQVGYKKAFSTLASQLRNRAWDGSLVINGQLWDALTGVALVGVILGLVQVLHFNDAFNILWISCVVILVVGLYGGLTRSAKSPS